MMGRKNEIVRGIFFICIFVIEKLGLFRSLTVCDSLPGKWTLDRSMMVKRPISLSLSTCASMWIYFFIFSGSVYLCLSLSLRALMSLYLSLRMSLSL